MLQHVFSVYGGQSTVATDLLVYHEKNAPLEAGYCIHNGGKFKLLIKTVGPGYPTQLPGSGSTVPMTSGPGYPDPGGKPRIHSFFYNGHHIMDTSLIWEKVNGQGLVNFRYLMDSH